MTNHIFPQVYNLSKANRLALQEALVGNHEYIKTMNKSERIMFILDAVPDLDKNFVVLGLTEIALCDWIKGAYGDC